MTEYQMSDLQEQDRRTWLSVDLVAITDDPDDPALVLYRRERDPHAGKTFLVDLPVKGRFDPRVAL